MKEKINVTIVEKNDRIGKKIMSTGNGRCNYSNINLFPMYYNNEEKFFSDRIKYERT